MFEDFTRNPFVVVVIDFFKEKWENLKTAFNDIVGLCFGRRNEDQGEAPESPRSSAPAPASSRTPAPAQASAQAPASPRISDSAPAPAQASDPAPASSLTPAQAPDQDFLPKPSTLGQEVLSPEQGQLKKITGQLTILKGFLGQESQTVSRSFANMIELSKSLVIALFGEECLKYANDDEIPLQGGLIFQKEEGLFVKHNSDDSNLKAFKEKMKALGIKLSSDYAIDNQKIEEAKVDVKYFTDLTSSEKTLIDKKLDRTNATIITSVVDVLGKLNNQLKNLQPAGVVVGLPEVIGQGGRVGGGKVKFK